MRTMPGLHKSLRDFLILLFFLLVFPFSAHAGQWGLDIFGLSYHFDRFDSQGQQLNDFNPGVGVNYVLRESKRSELKLDSGLYYSSGRSMAGFASLAWQRKWKMFLFGPAISVFQSPSYNHGHLFAAPMAIVSVRVKPFTFNVLPIPRYKDRNKNAAIGFFTTWNFQ